MEEGEGRRERVLMILSMIFMGNAQKNKKQEELAKYALLLSWRRGARGKKGSELQKKVTEAPFWGLETQMLMT